MFNRSSNRVRVALQSQLYPMLVLAALLKRLGLASMIPLSGTFPALLAQPAQAETFPPYCQQVPAAIAQKEKLQREAVNGNREAQNKYKALLGQHAERLKQCRNQTWPQNQAIWIRLYPCDVKPGVLDSVLDRIVDRGYNQVYVEAFYNGRVLLPANQNPTPWYSVLTGSGADNEDLLAQTIQKGRDRGLKVHAWLFGMNFGSSYVRRFDRQRATARNGLGQTSLTANIVEGLSTELGQYNPDEAFIDPYSPQVRQDYETLIAAIAQRRPDGILVDYIRYPRGYGAASVASKVQDLWIYGEASQQTLLQRARNAKSSTLLQRFLSQGALRVDDLKAVMQQFPQEKDMVWQGLNPVTLPKSPPSAQQAAKLQSDLWRLSVSHAAQGVIDFVNHAVSTIRNQRVPVGLVFFPEGNATVGQGYDSRLQLWDRFPASAEWHPMSYGICGNTSCIMQQIQRVLNQTPPGTEVKPVLAGIWQQPLGNRPPLEAQMQVLRSLAPQIKTVSHFAYSWQEPGSDRERKACSARQGSVR
ncbi:MAG: family 10 glycosylhydrolase [Leptolyngbyaceae cyanobacterium bins.349]|nr:family 10 glycosylhydrolase [Leptolyngbyaceae cyanobacterium bins.349]